MKKIQVKALQITMSLVRKLMPVREKNSNKKDFGHVLILAGSKNMAGAPVLCANAAIRFGAGLVSVGVPEIIRDVVAKKTRPEVMVRGFNANINDGTFGLKAFKEIKKFIIERKIDAIAIGPGISVNSSTIALVVKILQTFKGFIVLDADALNCIAKSKYDLSSSNAKIVITPHEGEFSRLSGLSLKNISSRRCQNACEFADKNKVVCVLKGSATVVSDGNKIFINTTGNPGMATAGCGDVLTGMIAAALCQITQPIMASVFAVYIHGFAGDIAVKDNTQIGMVASDISERLPMALKKMLQG